jgi:hypothetical protein
LRDSPEGLRRYEGRLETEETVKSGLFLMACFESAAVGVRRVFVVVIVALAAALVEEVASGADPGYQDQGGQAGEHRRQDNVALLHHQLEKKTNLQSFANKAKIKAKIRRFIGNQQYCR